MNTQFQKSVVAPHNPPTIKWHSELYVSVFRNACEILLFLVFLIIFFVFGPCFIMFLYPEAIVPLSVHFDNPDEYYPPLQLSNPVWQTNFTTGSLLINMQAYTKDHITPLREVEKVLLIIGDSNFPDFEADYVLCRPYSNMGAQPTFEDSVSMARICYGFVRQITRKAEIFGCAKGIAANILLAMAAELYEDSCHSFESLFLIEPITDVENYLFNSSRIGITFMFPWLRNKIMADAMKEVGLENAKIESNIRRINTTIIVKTENDFQSLFGEYDELVVNGDETTISEKLKTRRKETFLFSNLQVRHPSEVDCARKNRIPLTSLFNFL